MNVVTCTNLQMVEFAEQIKYLCSVAKCNGTHDLWGWIWIQQIVNLIFVIVFLSCKLNLSEQIFLGGVFKLNTLTSTYQSWSLTVFTSLTSPQAVNDEVSNQHLYWYITCHIWYVNVCGDLVRDEVSNQFLKGLN